MREPRRRRDGALEGAEEALQQHVLDCARLLGWLAYHTHDSRRSAEGFPDLVLVRPPRLAFAELKAWPEGTAKGEPTAAQRVWLDALLHAVHWREQMSAGAFEVYLWRWPDWTDGTIERILR